MAKTSVYLPDELAEQARAYGIGISEVAQAAVRQAVRAAQIRASVMTDIDAVAERLQATRIADAQADRIKAAKIRQHGVEWARRLATAAELEYVAGYAGPVDRYLAPTSLVFYASGERHRANTSSGMVPCRPGDPHWPDFLAGVREVWEAVQPLLTATDQPHRQS
jgi:post-segregation antitoxin (ccd killing protein)